MKRLRAGSAIPRCLIVAGFSGTPPHMEKPASRAIDHLVLPTAGLEIARQRLSALGFTVAPDGIHPFGTVNCCVYLADGTFLEPLAVGDEGATRDAASSGNVFVGRDSLFRAARGEEGFSAVVLASDDADRDHATFVASGISGGDMLTFSRQARDAAGNAGTASFRLAFASDAETNDAFLFTCQRVNVPAIDRSTLERHANGAVGIREIVVGAHAVRFMRLVRCATGRSGFEATPKVELANAVVRLAGADDPQAVGQSAAVLSAIVFAVGDIDRGREVLDAGGVDYVAGGARLVVPPAAGQGAVLIFEEQN